MSDIEKYKKLQARSMKELQYEMDRRNKLSEEYSSLEKEEVVRRYQDVRFRYDSASSRVSIVQGQLGLWTFLLAEAEKKES